MCIFVKLIPVFSDRLEADALGRVTLALAVPQTILNAGDVIGILPNLAVPCGSGREWPAVALPVRLGSFRVGFRV